MTTFTQGWEFAHWFSEKIAYCLRKNEQMSNSLKKNTIRSFAHFWWATWVICSHRSLKKGGMSESLIFFFVQKTYQKIWFKSPFFGRVAHSLIYHERPERIAHGRSFYLSDLSEWAHERWAIWVNERMSDEQMSNERMSEFPALHLHKHIIYCIFLLWFKKIVDIILQ